MTKFSPSVVLRATHLSHAARRTVLLLLTERKAEVCVCVKVQISDREKKSGASDGRKESLLHTKTEREERTVPNREGHAFGNFSEHVAATHRASSTDDGSSGRAAPSGPHRHQLPLRRHDFQDCEGSRKGASLLGTRDGGGGKENVCGAPRGDTKSSSHFCGVKHKPKKGKWHCSLLL